MRAAALAALALVLAAQPERRGPAARPNRPKPAAVLTENAIAERWLRGLTLRQKVAQLVVIRTHGSTGGARSREWRNVQRWVRDSGVGGMIVVNRVRRGAVVKAEPYETVHFINRLQRLARLPLLVAGDFERSVSMRFDRTIAYPHAMAYAAAGRTEWTEQLGRLTARESRALGFQWIFAPDADVNNNADNPIIGIRAFGVDPQTVSQHVKAFIAGAHSASPRTLVTVKHFPGHGDTATDSHLGLPVVESDRKRLDAIELPPFRAAIDAGVDAVMSAHIAMPKIDETGVPSTISPVVIGDLLRKHLGFEGLVTTDAMDMEALAREYGSAESSVRALESGVDVLLMPRDPDQAIAAILKAIAEKRLTVARVDNSVRKILRAKVKLGLHKRTPTDPDQIAEHLDDEESQQHAQRVADAAVAVLRGDRSRLPLPKAASTCILALAERRGNGQGQQLADEIKARSPQVRVAIADPLDPEFNTEGCSNLTVVPYLSFGGIGKLNPAFAPLIERLSSSGLPFQVAAAGNPFLVREFPTAVLALTTYSTVPVSESALVKVLFGENNAAGKPFVTFEK